MLACKILFDLSQFIFSKYQFFNFFLLYIIKDINGQSCVLACVQWLTATCILKRREYLLLITFCVSHVMFIC